MEDRTMEPIGKIVEDYRKARGMTQAQLGALMDVDQGTISRLESRSVAAGGGA